MAVDTDGRLYVRGGSSLFAISGSTGRILWRFDASADLQVPAALTPEGEILISDSSSTSMEIGSSSSSSSQLMPGTA